MYEEIAIEAVWDELENGAELIVVILPNDMGHRSRVTTTSKIAAGYIQRLLEEVIDCVKFYKKAGV